MSKDVFQLAWNERKLLGRFSGLFGVHGAAHLREIESEEIKSSELAGKGLGRCHADLGAGVSINSSGSFASNHGADDVADGQCLRAFGFGLALGGNGVGGFSGLRDHERDGLRADDGIAVAPFAGVIDLDRDAGEAFDHELAGLCGVPTGAAGHDVDLLRGAEFGFADLHFVEEDVASVERNAS